MDILQLGNSNHVVTSVAFLNRLKGDAHFHRTALDYACADANVFWDHIRHD